MNLEGLRQIQHLCSGSIKLHFSRMDSFIEFIKSILRKIEPISTHRKKYFVVEPKTFIGFSNNITSNTREQLNKYEQSHLI